MIITIINTFTQKTLMFKYVDGFSIIGNLLVIVRNNKDITYYDAREWVVNSAQWFDMTRGDVEL